MRLEADPRVPQDKGFFAAAIDWMRRAAQLVNGTADAVDAQQIQIAALQAALAKAGITGEFKQFMLVAAPAGWVAGDGGTIGNVGSGATRANADTQALFNAWWPIFTDAQVPMLTSAGAASSRGASAAADWAAGKRMTVFDVRNYFMRNGGGSLALVGTRYPGTEIIVNGGNASAIVVPWTGSVEGYDALDGLNASYNIVAPTGAATSVLQTAVVRPVNLGVLGCFKL